jgi:hypothetical protein
MPNPMDPMEKMRFNAELPLTASPFTPLYNPDAHKVLTNVARNATRELVMDEAVTLLNIYCRDPWVVIGSAAVWLAGGDVEVSDLDVLVSGADAVGLMTVWRYRLDASFVHSAEAAERFRSNFARYHFTAFPLEVMSDFYVKANDAWVPVEVKDTKYVRCGKVDVPIPTVPEQIRILELFGRPKDAQRIEVLRALL